MLRKNSTRLLFHRSVFCSCLALATIALTGCGSSDQVLSTMGISMYKDSAHQFAANLVKNTLEETVLTLTNSGTASVTVATPTLSGDTSYQLVTSKSCGTQLAGGASCAFVVDFTPLIPGQTSATFTVQDPISTAVTDRVAISGVASALHSGVILSTSNPLVAEYQLAPGVASSASVQFGTGTDYGLETSSQSASDGTITILVAGMRQNTQYHMKATLQLSNGNTLDDVDHTFTTSSFPSSLTLPTLSATTESGMTPQPGIELALGTLSASKNFLQAYAVDLQGNLIWGYTYAGQQSAIVQPLKLMSNGHMILVASFASQAVTGPTSDSTLVTLREIDLVGNTIRELTLQDLNSKLAAAGDNLTLTDFHHDVTVLPNGHFLLLTNTLKSVSNVTGYTGTQNVLGDVLVDLDENFNPVWIWNEFDHLDVNRHPIGFPDWTHSNAVLYSSDDGNILVSSRHQSWIMKIDYRDGNGTGNVLWRLGEGGDFKLINGTDPTDWFYGQHQPAFLSSNTTGVFTLSMMDNGFGRISSAGTVCGATDGPCYSRAPVFQVDETAKTATLVYPNQQPSSEFAIWGGGTTQLANGNLEYDLCAEPNYTSIVREIVQSQNPTLVWQLNIGGMNAYRANRIPSLYPGVQW